MCAVHAVLDPLTGRENGRFLPGVRHRTKLIGCHIARVGHLYIVAAAGLYTLLATSIAECVKQQYGVCSSLCQSRLFSDNVDAAIIN